MGPLLWQVSGGPSPTAANGKPSLASVNLAGAPYLCFKSSCSKGDTFCHQSHSHQHEANGGQSWYQPKPYQTAIYRCTGNHAGPWAFSLISVESLISSAARGTLILCAFSLNIALSSGRICMWLGLGRLVMR